jgi:ABC-type phosphate transport system substrate-binding protein
MRKILSFLFFVAASASLAQLHAQAIVIANPSIKGDSISKSVLRDVYTGTITKLADGSHLRPVFLKDEALRAEFVKGKLGASEIMIITGWRKLVFAGQGTMPKEFDSEAAVVEYVAHTPGAIGYVRAATPHEGVKVLELN